MTPPIPIAKSVAGLQSALEPLRRAGKRIGFVPTMGALHEGHLSLLQEAKRQSDFAVLSVFVNPEQFGPSEDYARYPRDLKADAALAAGAGADHLFAPSPETVYPNGFCTRVEVTGLSDRLCGARRPGHFRGVTTVVWKLLQIVDPDLVFFGAKDAQQVVLIRKMIHDLNGPWEVRSVATVREEDGLAKSSRNRYLAPPDRERAATIHRALRSAFQTIVHGERSAGTAEKIADAILKGMAVDVEHLSTVSLSDLEPLVELQGDVLLAVAARFGETRLIDNVCFRVAGDEVEEILP